MRKRHLKKAKKKYAEGRPLTRREHVAVTAGNWFVWLADKLSMWIRKIKKWVSRAVEKIVSVFENHDERMRFCREGGKL